MKKQKNPKVSVIVPNYNYGQFLKERIDSVLNQSYQDFELIILDDCSTDNSCDIIESYRNNPHVSKIVYNDVNTGSPFVQWDRGINLSSGEWIWIAESDDKASPVFLSTLLGEIEKHSGVVLAFSDSHYIDCNGVELNTENSFADSIMNACVHDGKRYAHKRMLWGNYIYNASMVLFSKCAYNAINKDYRNYLSCGDWVFWMNMCLQGNIIECYEKMNFFRQHSNRVTEKSGKSWNNWREVGSLLSSFISLLNIEGLELKRFRGKWTNDFRLSHFPDKRQLQESFPQVFKGSVFDVYYYKLYDRFQKLFS